MSDTLTSLLCNQDTTYDPVLLDALASDLAGVLGPKSVSREAPLARYTTWKVGGPADVLGVAHSVENLCRAVEVARRHGVPWIVLGRGSNVLIADEGVAGLVILNRCASIAIEGSIVSADAGTMLSALAKRTVAAGLRGLEWAAGIPGTVGGAVVSNAGAHGSDMSAHMLDATVLEVDGQRTVYPASALDLSYRHSIFRARNDDAETALLGRHPVVLSVRFTLTPDDPRVLDDDLATQRAQRRRTQPQGQANAGSVFKNPSGESAGRLIDSLGLKGYICGGVQISPVHANFMVNLGTARATDIAALIHVVRSRVHDVHGIDLHPEVQKIGRWSLVTLTREG